VRIRRRLSTDWRHVLRHFRSVSQSDVMSTLVSDVLRPAGSNQWRQLATEGRILVDQRVLYFGEELKVAELDRDLTTVLVHDVRIWQTRQTHRNTLSYTTYFLRLKKTTFLLFITFILSYFPTFFTYLLTYLIICKILRTSTMRYAVIRVLETDLCTTASIMRT